MDYLVIVEREDTKALVARKVLRNHTKAGALQRAAEYGPYVARVLNVGVPCTVRLEPLGRAAWPVEPEPAPDADEPVSPERRALCAAD